MDSKLIIDKLCTHRKLDYQEWYYLIENRNTIDKTYIFQKAREIRQQYYSNSVYLRGLIEITNICKKDCLYCGIRCSNKEVKRYRLTKTDILECCKLGDSLGLKTFVMQGGEDHYYSDEILVDIIKDIKHHYPQCAITLSLGERSNESYQKLYNAGVDRYLLRHETADELHYSTLHPAKNTLKKRKECLQNIKEIGFQVGCGFMVGSPNQTIETLVKDFCFLQDFQPDMVGVGPFIPHHATPFRNESAGTLEDTLFYLGLIRILLPKVLLPATTALKTIDEDGFIKGMEVGCNVIMPNLTPSLQKSHYALYDNKNGTSVHEIEQISKEMNGVGFMIDQSRGDHIRLRGKEND